MNDRNKEANKKEEKEKRINGNTEWKWQFSDDGKNTRITGLTFQSKGSLLAYFKIQKKKRRPIISSRWLWESVFGIKILKQLPDFHEILYEPYVNGGSTNPVLLSQSIRATWRSHIIARRERTSTVHLNRYSSDWHKVIDFGKRRSF